MYELVYFTYQSIILPQQMCIELNTKQGLKWIEMNTRVPKKAWGDGVDSMLLLFISIDGKNSSNDDLANGLGWHPALCLN
jgi:hypothetical protein